ncbi:hypothetical protein V8B55DRAFT_1454125 [Mucor lusitanicus]|uniref:DUF8032 domain-containing protein n=2 Tax=Mucor circinelloides f. lusitanicus TaxID=29924 RepID=A0A162QSA5_MUCCL|nr:hypothetical protein FB192DRAFT_1348976 [Mucor lusitanicus]OAD01789.1 hypothetical protein MUCCIDRAFT_163744 [Mucor lusitanicus CBS 277.49]
MNNSTAYLNTSSEQIFASTNSEFTNNSTFPATWCTTATNNTAAPFNPSQQVNFMDVLGSNDLDMSIWPLGNVIDQPIQQRLVQQQQQQQQPIIDPLDDIFAPWNSNMVQVPPTIKEEWPLSNSNVLQEEPLSYLPMSTSQSQASLNMLPITPPGNASSNSFASSMQTNKQPTSFNNYNAMYSTNMPQHQFSREITPPSSTSASGSNSPNSSVSTPPPMAYYLPPQHQQQPMLPQQVYHTNAINYNNAAPVVNTASTHTPATHKVRGPGRRRSADGHAAPTRTYRRRASSHPSVASVVSLSAHEPVSRIIDGIEYITFLYSHDRLVKEYTVRTNVDSVNLDDIPAGFRVQNAIYPRANVSREEYDGNRWEYETSCNKLGWELCWLNQEQLCGRRGLIQRAVDSYRNRHAEMRSRRVTRQEKVANGTLRKRRAKKAASALL